jgi:GNAT superfamily N-acetyltransferase
MSATPEVEIRGLTPSDGDLLRRMYARVLEPSFDRDELEDVDSLVQGLEGTGPTELGATAALDSSGAALGGLIVERFPHAPDVLLLSYVAVRPDARGRGVGTMLMRSAANAWRDDPRVLLVVGEVHDPREWPRNDDEDPIARLRLYERLGARALALPFIQPALDTHRARVPGFLLLAFHTAAAAHASPYALRTELVSGFIRAYYLVAEGPPRADDVELQGLVGWVDRQPSIPLVAIDHYQGIPTVGSIRCDAPRLG